MKKKLEITIKHIEDNFVDGCGCRICSLQENGSFLDGLKEALKLTPKRK